MKQKYEYKDGVVSLVVCLFIMIIVSLIALSFAAIMRREQRQALDRQLNSEAFYAAETGINDALTALRADAAAVGDISSCDTASQNKISSALERQLDATSGVSYTCVFVDQTPLDLTYDVGNGTVTAIPIHTSSTITSIKISWQDKNPANLGNWLGTYDGNTDFPPAANWQTAWPGMLRMQLIPDTYPLTRGSVNTGTINAFAIPAGSGGSSTFTAGTTADGSVLRGICNATHTGLHPYDCEVTIDGLTQANYLLTLRGIYDDSNVIVQAFNSGAQLELRNAQVAIDSTGLANGLAKRVKVFVPVENVTYPGFALEVAGDICKRLSVLPTGVSSDAVYVNQFVCDPNKAAP